MSNSHVILGLSGGVDSSVAAFLLKEQGYKVSAVFMQNWESAAEDTHCPIEADLADAQILCDQLDIELRLVNFSAEYWAHVFTHFLDEYQRGRTPNPDILCNSEIKFKAFLNYAKSQGAHSIATGHYVRSHTHNQQTYLLKGLDAGKDQSYFLHALNQEQLAYSLFPIGEMQKDSVRQLAKKLNFKNHAKKDSTGICFIGERHFRTFLSDYLPAKSGPMVSVDGEMIGQHSGLMFYTIGQRQGLNIGGLRAKANLPWYVVHKDIANNKLIVAQGEHPSLYAQLIEAKEIHWINAVPSFPLKCAAKTRYRQADEPCIIQEGDENVYHIRFERPIRAVTPGQSIVFYQDDICLGGGIIEKSL